MAQKTQSPEFSNPIFVKFLGHIFLYFKLFIYLPEIKRPQCFRDFTPFLEHLLTGLLYEPVTELIYSTSRSPPAFYSIFVPKWTLGYYTFKTTSLKEIEFDYSQKWIWSIWCYGFKSPDRYISLRKVVRTNIKSVSRYIQVG